MIGGVNCRGGLPGVRDRGTCSARVKFCQGGVPAYPGLDSCYIKLARNAFGGGFFFLIKGPDSDMNAPDHSTERLQQEQQVSLEKH